METALAPEHSTFYRDDELFDLDELDEDETIVDVTTGQPTLAPEQVRTMEIALAPEHGNFHRDEEFFDPDELDEDETIDNVTTGQLTRAPKDDEGETIANVTSGQPIRTNDKEAEESLQNLWNIAPITPWEQGMRLEQKRNLPVFPKRWQQRESEIDKTRRRAAENGRQAVRKRHREKQEDIVYGRDRRRPVQPGVISGNGKLEHGANAAPIVITGKILESPGQEVLRRATLEQEETVEERAVGGAQEETGQEGKGQKGQEATEVLKRRWIDDESIRIRDSSDPQPAWKRQRT
jgi:hypothetical protein